MNGKMTALVLRDTGHVLSAYTQRSGAGAKDVSPADLERRFLNGLSIRGVPSVSGRSCGTTTADFDPGGTTLKIKDCSDVRPGDVLIVGVKDNPETHVIVIVVTVGDDETDSEERTLEVKLLTSGGKVPVNSPVVLVSVERHFYRRRAFSIPPRYFDAVEFELAQAAISRPMSMTLVDGKIGPIAQDVKTLEFIVLEPRANGINVTLNPRADASIPDVPAACIMRTVDNLNLVSTVQIPRGGPKVPVKSLIPFPVIPSGTNRFLFLLKGFRAFSAEIELGKQVIWIPTSP